MVPLNSIILTTVAVFGVFNNYTYVLTIDVNNQTKIIDFQLSDVMDDVDDVDNHEMPGPKDKLINTKWDHAVNSKAEITKALKSDSTMIEADVILGHLDNANSNNVDSTVEGPVIPIMGLSPAKKSDLSLQEFLYQCKYSNKTVVKLDFKSTDAFKAAIPIMKKLFEDLKSPAPKIWLNADILPGPCLKDQPVVDADSFIQNSKSFPDAMLSLSWTTTNSKCYYYRPENIMDMGNLLRKNKYNKPVTYAVKASLAANSNSITRLEYLLALSPIGSTLTIWCNDESEVLNYDDLVDLAKRVKIQQVYWDLPDRIFNKFVKHYNAPNTGSTRETHGLSILAEWWRSFWPS